MTCSRRCRPATFTSTTATAYCEESGPCVLLLLSLLLLLLPLLLLQTPM